ncbi:membrane protein [Bradyrhizobium sp. SSBR45G]|uniref:outer membrane protein n=1 Tax=unclassified Bradyrhizobium TaxID=2631580 RepID=UPI00234296A9|nr:MULTISPECIES: outer membrane beta-barrel protein [unclassified Bradyrhizobium]GLH75314.1 membrane protein [Bradyrhizobium sp. SSBR45G]GLH82899.1 membrane protein [Bradyrhizobium sp. SSBR45R]
MLKIGSIVAALATVTCAQAADLPLKAAATPPSAASFSWTGCFVGGQLGAAISDDKIRSSGDFSSVGAAAGGQIGCDYQLASPWVIGIEGRASWLGLKSDTPGRLTDLNTGLTVPTHFTVRNDLLASATARLGYGFASGWLGYARGGAAWTREKSDIVFTLPGRPTFDPRGTRTVTGWTAGAGVEWAFAQHWSVNFEYNYYSFGDNAFRLTDPASNAFATGSLKDRINEVHVGLNYRF